MVGDRFHLLNPNGVFSTIYVELKRLPIQRDGARVVPGTFEFVSYGNREVIPFVIHRNGRRLIADWQPGQVLEIYPSFDRETGAIDGADFIFNRRERVRFRKDDDDYLDPTEEIAILWIKPIADY